jgi:hypothetical protein
MTIDMKKKYRTRNGLDVRVYAIDGSDGVHGAFNDGLGWKSSTWLKNGCWSYGVGPMDLVEIKPPVVKFRNVYSGGNFGLSYATMIDAINDCSVNQIGILKISDNNGDVSIEFIKKDWKNRHDA